MTAACLSPPVNNTLHSATTNAGLATRTEQQGENIENLMQVSVTQSLSAARKKTLLHGGGVPRLEHSVPVWLGQRQRGLPKPASAPFPSVGIIMKSAQKIAIMNLKALVIKYKLLDAPFKHG